jgi:hypothetical protein
VEAADTEDGWLNTECDLVTPFIPEYTVGPE